MTVTRLRTMSYWLAAKPATKAVKSSTKKDVEGYQLLSCPTPNGRLRRPLISRCSPPARSLSLSANSAGPRYPDMRSISPPDASVKTVVGT